MGFANIFLKSLFVDKGRILIEIGQEVKKVAKKRLVRPRKGRVIAGVCAGIAEYFDVDPVLVRLLLLLFFMSGGSILFYLIAWLVMPDENNIKGEG